MRTTTPELDDYVLRRLTAYAAKFAPDFRRKDQARWTEAYLRGLLQDGERKSVEPLVRRVHLPPQCQSIDPTQAVQHWLNQGSWDADRLMAHYRALMGEEFASDEGRFIFDDTSYVKQGKHSVGVQRQYCGAMGKRANCQVAVSLHYSTPSGHYPLDLRLYLPQSWTSAPDRLDECKVPLEHRQLKTKHTIALELLDRVRAEGLPGRFVLGDAGYNSSDFRAALDERELTYMLGVKGAESVFTEEPRWVQRDRGRRGPAPWRPRLASHCGKPRSVAEVAATLRLRKCTWREDSKKRKMSARFGRIRVWPAFRWTKGECAGVSPVWLVVEERGDELRYAFSNAPANASLIQLVRLLKERWPVEQGYQQLKEELGLDHFEGRSWRGFHHHVAMVFLAYGFLELERHRIETTRQQSRRTPKKNEPNMDESALCPACASELARAVGHQDVPTMQDAARKSRTDVME